MTQTQRFVNAVRTSVLLGAACVLALVACPARAQEGSAGVGNNGTLKLETEAVTPQRFIAVHGRRALVAGYASEGLEVWGYPFQILSGYEVAFRPAGVTTSIRGNEILRRVIYEPDSITRVYLGPDFIVREKIFVPLNEPGAVISYSVQGGRQVDIEVHAMPVLNLMWPAAVGGQEIAWNPSLSAFVLSEQAYGFSAAVGSPDIVAHDDADNRASHGASENGFSFTLHTAASGEATVFVALNAAHAADPGQLLQSLIRNSDKLQAEAEAEYREAGEKHLRVETPDDRVNQAIAWSEVALEQAWVCNPGLGCGYVAGYGPTRGARRPQYDWFFAGDGLVAADAAVSAGDGAHARDELRFILRYQDSKTGMIWHELSQSAKFLDWTGKYPYMFVHVDITFQFLETLGRYVAATGNTAFASENWPAIEAAYQYCRSVIDPNTGLPRIPPGKEGGDEQDRMSDDLGLSVSWIDAALSFAQLAALAGHTAVADEAAQAAQRARESIPARYWSDSEQFWISGRTESGQPMAERRSGPADALTMHVFNELQNEHLLDELASASFETDWGTRSVAAGSAGFDAESYGKGSVWPVGTASMAEAFWSEHRPVTALEVWRTLLPLSRLDSLGHMPEVLAGNFYRPQIESVPEQTWSSAGFLDATIHGLLGLSIDATANHLVFAPRLPADWNHVSISHIQMSGASLSLRLQREGDELTLKIDNPGGPFKFEFVPDLPLGARLRSATFNHLPVAVTVETHPQQTNARAVVTVPHGESELQLSLQGGVSVIPEAREPLLGSASEGVRIVDVHLAASVLTVVADVPTDCASHVRVKSKWQVGRATGATVKQTESGFVDITFNSDQNASAPYRRAEVTIEFKP